MRITIAAVPVVIGRFKLQIREPGTIRGMAFERKPTLVMTRGAPDFEEVPILFIESSPNMPARTRTFVVITHGEVVESDDAESADWRATTVGGPKGALHCFEVKEMQA
jgi:hypothetical protein